MTTATGSAVSDVDDDIATTNVLIAIVNYCTAELTIDCLRSLARELDEFPHAKVVVADNASPDGSGMRIADAIATNAWSSWANVMHLPRNGGFAYGNNAIVRAHLDGSRSASTNSASVDRPEFVWLLNSDTVVRPGALRALVEVLRRNADVGIVGSRLEDPDGTPQHSAFRFHSIPGEFESNARIGIISRLLSPWVLAPERPPTETRCDWLAGASAIVRTEVFESIGLMDEGYFLYYEETDFCLRARKQGWSCCYAPQSRVVHLVGSSTGVTRDRGPPRRRAAFWYESRTRYFLKHHGRLYAIGADAALTAGMLLWRLRRAVERQPSYCPPFFLRDLARHSAIFVSALEPAPE